MDIPVAGWRERPLRLKSGFVEIEFWGSGAAVVLERPADFEIVSPIEAFCSRGKLRATVPPHARGLRSGLRGWTWNRPGNGVRPAAGRWDGGSVDRGPCGEGRGFIRRVSEGDRSGAS